MAMVFFPQRQTPLAAATCPSLGLPPALQPDDSLSLRSNHLKLPECARATARLTMPTMRSNRMTFGDRLRTWVFGLAVAALTVATAPAALAAYGRAEPYQLGFQDAATPVAHDIAWFHSMVLWLMVAVTLFVMGLLIYVMVKFNDKANPTPQHFHHNTTLEIAWTVIPIAILVFISIPSFRLLYGQYSFPKPDLTIKAIGVQWYWTYEYPDTKGLGFDSYMLADDVTAKMRAEKLDAPRLLAVDNEVVVPVNKVVHVLITAKDVIHNWNIPSFGVKSDAVPGRVTATWFKAERPGVYYGVCSELCGAQHAFMPIAVRVVSDEVFAKWLDVRKAGGKGVDDKARAVIQATIETPNPSKTVAALVSGAPFAPTP
jgi:cytochrome c oxidase subunit II